MMMMVLVGAQMVPNDRVGTDLCNMKLVSAGSASLSRLTWNNRRGLNWPAVM